MSEDLAQLNLVELLDLLEAVPEPPPVSLLPETAGWIWLGLVLLTATVWVILRWRRQRRANAYRRAALQEIAAAGNDPATVAQILRRTALTAFPRSEVAGLHGEDWLAFLDRTYGGTGFLRGPGQLLAVAPYAQSAETADLTPLAAEWVRCHRCCSRAPS